MRASGILMHISSLPSPYGIGSLGKEAYAFVDFLKDAGQKLWQILPITPTSYGDSPYQSFSTFAGNPYFIDLDLLQEDGLLEKEEYENCCWGADPERVDYASIYHNRFPILRVAYTRFHMAEPADFADFRKENESWLPDYALFMALKDGHEGLPWSEWEEGIRLRQPDALEEAKADYAAETGFWEFLQYTFYKQWRKLKEYANEQGVRLIGDIPIYVALDSADVWANPEMFRLDEERRPIEVAGCPPDYFSETGQLWGNPLYDWDYCQKTGYDWWIRRIAAAAAAYDLVRIDHFRGFESFWAVPAEEETAVNGVWRKGPGMELFCQMKQQLGEVPIIAEDLGIITDEVRELLQESGYPGMKVLQFAFTDGYESAYLPHNHVKNCVCYTGTHDNDTIAGCLASADEADLEYMLRYLRVEKPEDAVWGMIAAAWASTADTAITTMQDILELGSEARMNIPSTSAANWSWRMKPDMLTPALTEKLLGLTKLYWR